MANAQKRQETINIKGIINKNPVVENRFSFLAFFYSLVVRCDHCKNDGLCHLHKSLTQWNSPRVRKGASHKNCQRKSPPDINPYYSFSLNIFFARYTRKEPFPLKDILTKLRPLEHESLWIGTKIKFIYPICSNTMEIFFVDVLLQFYPLWNFHECNVY